jgi:hypothetical protein
MFNIQLSSPRVILIGIGLFLGVVGCQPTVSVPNITVAVTKEIANEQTDTLLSATSIMSTRLISKTAISIQTPSPTSQPTLTPFSTGTATPTPTPWATLPPDEAANKVLSLLADNQNPDCLLPCWWGATPGQTQWWDIQPYLQSFALQIYTYPQDSLNVIAFPVPSHISSLEELHIGYSYNQSDIIISISVPSLNIEGYDAKTMVTLYGIPDEVWVRTLDAPYLGTLPFELIVVYQKQGFSLYYSVDASLNDDIVTACFEPGFIEIRNPDLFPASPRIYIWEGGNPKSIDEIVREPDAVFFPLEEKTDLTSETLYEKFTSSRESPCIDTPSELWRVGN